MIRPVFSLLSHKLLPLLQLTRMALVFTAIADAACSFLLLHRLHLNALPWHELGCVVGISVGLYGFGMSLNDIIDRRRDGTVAPHRPLPSNRMGVTTAHLVCSGLFMLAMVSAAAYSYFTGIWFSLGLAIFTGLLIYFYDVAGKYLVAMGLLSLGLIRFFHCLIPAPQLPVLWHPLLLLNHVAVLSAIAYHLEEKRPALTRSHWWTALGGLAVVNVTVIVLVATRRADRVGSWVNDLNITPGLLLPLAAMTAFAGLATWTIRRGTSGRAAGQTLMLYGLLWLIVYDAAFVGAYVSWPAAIAVAMLLPIAYFSVQLMRWWSAVVAISQRPAYKRAES